MRLRTARAILRTIVNRAHSDSAYFELLRSRPFEILVKEGLPYDLIEDFLEETRMNAEVNGYLLAGCANTCALTGIGAYPSTFQSC